MKWRQYIKTIKREKWTNPFTIKNGGFRDGKLATVYRTNWAEESYITDSGGRETVGRNFKTVNLALIGGVIAVFMVAVLFKTAWLQIVKGDYYYQLAEGNRVRVERIEPKRGIIYDRSGRPLVRNQPNFLLYFIPADLPGEDEALLPILDSISAYLGDMSVDELRQIVLGVDRGDLEAYRPLFVTDNIPYETAMKLYLASDNWPGVFLSNKSNREYLTYALEEDKDQAGAGLSMSHILGYTGKINQDELDQFGDEYLPIDYIGKMGVEYFWENELKGVSGKKQVEVDALGKEKKLIGEEPAQDGHNIVLSIDTVMQVKLESILAKQMAAIGKSRGVAIVMDPQSGEVLAMVSLPAYNNNAFARGITADEYAELMSQPDKPLFNRAVSGEYPSGSTIKPIWAAAALQERIISENTAFLSVGGIRIGEWYFPDWRAGGHGRVDVRRALAESVNTFFYYIGGGYEDFTGLGVDKMVSYGELFGLGSQTGIDLAGEANGFLPTREWKESVKGERWYIGDTYHMAIGQGDLLVTPLQVAAYTSVFANGGKLYRPHLIKQILSGNDKPLQIAENEPIREGFIDDYNIEVVRSGMRQTITSGSARSLQTVPVAVAGKTGTAQWSTQKDTHAWFTGFAPYDRPELAITILIEEGGEGSDTAVPVAREFLTWYFGEYKGKTSGD